MDWTVFYTCFIVGGFVLPVLNVAAGAVGGALHSGGSIELDTDFDLDMDLDLSTEVNTSLDSGHAPIPVNLMTVSFGAVVFGAVGNLVQMSIPVPVGLALSAVLALLGGGLLGRFVLLPLKRNRAYATNIHRLKGTEAVVQLEIRSDFEGKVALSSATGSILTYSARPVPGVERLLVGQSVIIVGVEPERGVCIVQPIYDIGEIR